MGKEINQEIGARVRARRVQLHLSRERLSEHLGISSRFLASVESGEAGMSLTTLKAMCQALAVSADDLLFGAAAESPDPARERLQAQTAALEPALVPLAETMLRCLRQAAQPPEVDTAQPPVFKKEESDR